MTVGRTLVGAAAALALYAFFHSGLLAVGFSERLLERAVAGVGGADEAPTSADRTEERGTRAIRADASARASVPLRTARRRTRATRTA